jgi:hypothetical protein
MIRLADVHPKIADAVRRIPDDAIANDPDVAAAKRCVDVAEAECQRVGAQLGKQHERIAEARARLAMVKSELSTLQDAMPALAGRVVLGETPQKAYDDAQARVSELKRQAELFSEGVAEAEIALGSRVHNNRAGWSANAALEVLEQARLRAKIAIAERGVA